MEFRNLEKTDIKISVVTFGAWAIGGWMWGGADEKDAIDALEAAIDLGMTSIDTAAVYGFGKSEELVGKVIYNKRDRVQIMTKYGLRWNTKKGAFYFNSTNEKGEAVSIHRFAGPQSVMEECEASLKRLKTDYIDLYQIHWNDPTTPIEDTMEAVSRLQEQGKILEAGASNYSVEQMTQADKIVNIVSNQVPYSMVLRDIEKEVVPYCIMKGKSVLAYSPLQRGILTGKITQKFKFNEGDHRPRTPYFKKPNITRINNFLAKIKPMAAENDISLTQLVIYWTIQQPSITSALVGARNRKQVEENVGAGEIHLDKEVIKTINNLLEEVKLDLGV